MPTTAFRMLPVRWTIKRKIAVAFTGLSVIMIALGVIFVEGAGRAGKLVEHTYDETVNTTIYARAASTDFASMRAAFARDFLSKGSAKDPDTGIVEAFHYSFEQDIATAVESSRSPAIARAAEDVRIKEGEWLAAVHQMGGHFDTAAWTRLEEKADRVEQGVETMVGKVADEGYANREVARATVARDILLALSGTTAALFICGLVAIQLSRRISTPLTQAAGFAEAIATGKLDGEAPSPGADEIGDLNRSMISMRNNIRAMMDEQTVLQAQSQARVAEALDGTSEGMVVVQADGRLQIINAKALDILRLDRAEAPTGVLVETLIKRVTREGDDRSALLLIGGQGPEVSETRLPDGRWIQNSRNRTAEGGMVALYTDVTTLRAQKDALAAANLNLDGAMTNMSQGLCVFDAENRLTLANPQFYAIMGLDRDEARTGMTHDALLAMMVASGRYDQRDAERVTRYERGVIRRRRPMKRLVTMGECILAVTHAPIPEGGWLATIEDVTERRKAESRISFLATHDALTKLPNRTLFAERVDEAVSRATRGMGFAIQCLDLDHFKQVNDSLGHAVGDELLREATKRLHGCVREMDTVARLGGDEFAILQSNVATELECSTLARRVIEAVSAPYQIQDQTIVIGVSVGIARAPQHGLDHGKLLKFADAALYKAKEEGRGVFRFFEHEMSEKLQKRRALEGDLRLAVANEEFEVFYQPLLDVKTMEIGSFEALVRWNHPTRGLVPPGDFIAVAEETGTINEIGRWVMRAACAKAAEWAPNIRIAVNVSAIQLRSTAFTTMVEQALADSGLLAERLEVEITESVFMANTAKITPMLLSLRDLGVHFAMDDFGTGYSSLSNLRAFPFGKIKIDRSFVRDLGQMNGAEQIITTIVMLGKTLGMRVTAEGVETRKQLKFLEDVGCDEIQGYLIGQPMRAIRIPELLAQVNKPDAKAAA